MAPKRKITVDLPNSRKSRDKNDRVDRPISETKNRENSRNNDKDRPERNIVPDREDANRSSERERTSNKTSSGNSGNIFPNERGVPRDRDRDNKDRSGGDSSHHRASVFSRLGKGPLNASNSSSSNTSQQKGICRPWADTGHCPYGNECRFKHISNLVSPSKRSSGSYDGRDTKEKERDSGVRAAGHREEPVERTENRERLRQSGGDREQLRAPQQASSKDSGRKDIARPGSKNPTGKHNLASKLGGKLKTDSPLIDPNWENWDEDNLDYDDELMLEKKRQLLQRELEKQMAVDGGVNVETGSIAPGSSTKGQKGTALPNVQPSGLYPAKTKTSSKKVLEDKSSSSSTSSGSEQSSSSSDSGSSSGSSTSSESSEESDGQGTVKKKAKNTAASKRITSSSGIGLPSHKAPSSISNTFPSTKHRDRSSRASSISSSETKRKRKDRSGRSSRISSKKSRSSTGRSKSSVGSKNPGSAKKDKKRPDRKSKTSSSKHSGSKREDTRGKSPRHGKRDKRSISSDRNAVGGQNSSRNRRSSHSPQQPNSNKKRRPSGGHTEERPRDHKFDRDKAGSVREHKNSYTSATGAAGSGRDRDLRRSDTGNLRSASLSKEYINRDEKHDNRNRDFSRGNTERFDTRGKFGRDASNDTSKERWNSSRNEANKSTDRRSNEGTSNIDQRRDGHHSDRDRRALDRSITPRDSEKPRGGYDRTPPHGFRSHREEWNRSPVGDRNKESWDDGGSVWNRDRGSSPIDRRKGNRQTAGSNSTILSGANSVPVKAEQVMQRRGKSPFGSRDRNIRSRSRERLLPPQALNRSTGNVSDHRENNRGDRRNTNERDRSPRADRIARPNDDHIVRRSPRDGSRGSTDRFTQRRERGADSFDDRHDRDRRKDLVANANTFARMDRSRSRETRAGDKFTDEGTLKEGNNVKNFNNRTDDAYYEACIWSEVESVATNDIPSETAGEIGSNQMGTEEYSDFDSDSGEEWLNDMRDDKEETEEAPTSNNEPENMIKDSGKETFEQEGDNQNENNLEDHYSNDLSEKLQKRSNKHDGLLEGISDEDLDDVSDEENGERNGQSAKLADALGVDWSQLVELQQKHKDEENNENSTNATEHDMNEKDAHVKARRKYWTPIAIFNRIGLPRSFLSDSFYNNFVKELNDNAQDGEKLELLHENAGYHMRLKELRERRKNLFVTGPYSRPMLARQEIAIRRELCGLPKEEFCEVPLRPNTDMELWNKAVELMIESSSS